MNRRSLLTTFLGLMPAIAIAKLVPTALALPSATAQTGLVLTSTPTITAPLAFSGYVDANTPNHAHGFTDFVTGTTVWKARQPGMTTKFRRLLTSSVKEIK